MEEIIVFGRGEFFRRIEEAIKREYLIVAFLDNGVRPNEECYEKGTNIPIKNPNEIMGMGEYSILLMIAEYMEPYHQLLELGVSCQTAHCGRYKPHIVFGELTSPIVLYRNLPQTPGGMTADCCSLV